MHSRNGFAPIAIILIVIAFLAVAAVAYRLGIERQTPPPAPAPVATSTGAYQTGDATVLSADKAYENDLLKITIPAGWSYTDLPNGSINIMKGDYILYINPDAGHASGIAEGRFGEIAEGAPSADAVDNRYPDACGSSDFNSAMPGFSRIDLYISAEGSNPYNKPGAAVQNVGCNSPRSGTVWYFAYISTNGASFNDYPDWINPQNSLPHQFVITMASKITDPSALPQKGSAGLKQALAEMTAMLGTLHLKHGGSPTIMSTEYRNDQYGFSFSLPRGWSGYSLAISRWQGSVEGNGSPTEFGPTITLNDVRTAPSPEESWQDIPIMVYTIAQWNKDLIVSAAPVGPAELGRNNKYVFALPPRAVGFRATLGVQEVEDWLQTHPLHAFNVP